MEYLVAMGVSLLTGARECTRGALWGGHLDDPGPNVTTFNDAGLDFATPAALNRDTLGRAIFFPALSLFS